MYINMITYLFFHVSFKVKRSSCNSYKMHGDLNYSIKILYKFHSIGT